MAIAKSFVAVQLPADPSVSNQAANRNYVDAGDSTRVPATRTVTAGTGLTGGGALSADIALSVAYGTTSTTACVGNDARLSDARTPTAHASSHGSAGSDPISPASIGAAASTHTHAESDITGLVTDLAGKVPTSRTVTAGTGLTGGGDLSANRTLTVSFGTSSTTVCAGDDSRLSNARTPTAHKSTHATGGTDALAPSDIGAATSTHTHSAPSTYTITYATTISADRANGSNQKVTATGNITSLGVGATGGVDGESVMIRVLASSASRTISPATGIIGDKTIPSGHVGFFQFVYDSDRAAFINVGYGASG